MLTTTLKFCIYVDYTQEEIPRPFYVGKGTQTRVNRKKRNQLHSNIAKKYGQNRRVLFETDDELEAYDKERELIAFYKTYKDEGWGANLDKGGQGGRDTPKSEEHRSKISRAHVGKVCSAEHRAAMSTGGKGKILSEEHKEKIRKATKLALAKPETKEKQKAAAIVVNQIRWSRPLTDEGREKIRIGCQKRYERQLREGFNRKPCSEETKEKIRRAHRERALRRELDKTATASVSGSMTDTSLVKQ